MKRSTSEAHARIAGGFVAIEAAELFGAWAACLGGRPGVGGFRAWLAAREMVVRRRVNALGRTPAYGLDELAGLLGVSPRTAGMSVRRLVAAGLITWDGNAISFPAPDRFDHAGDRLGDTIGKGKGAVFIPRRLLRWLAQGARPALIATALASLLRCVSRRRAGFTSRGRMASSWVVRTFGIDLRRVKEARSELVARGWLSTEPSDAWAINRWGAAWTVNLAWTRRRLSGMGMTAASGPRDDCHPQGSDSGASLPPPDLHPYPLREKEHPEPGPPGPAGALPGQGRTAAIPRRSLTAAERAPSQVPPNLRDIVPADLDDTARTLAIHDRAVAAGWSTASEADRLRIVAAAEHARAAGASNPPGLFRMIIQGRRYGLLTQGDEDRAARRLREHGRGAADPGAAGRGDAGARPGRGAGRADPGPRALSGVLAGLAGRFSPGIRPDGGPPPGAR